MPRAGMVALQPPRDPVLVCVMVMDQQALLGCNVMLSLFLQCVMFYSTDLQKELEINYSV